MAGRISDNSPRATSHASSDTALIYIEGHRRSLKLHADGVRTRKSCRARRTTRALRLSKCGPRSHRTPASRKFRLFAATHSASSPTGNDRSAPRTRQPLPGAPRTQKFLHGQESSVPAAVLIYGDETSALGGQARTSCSASAIVGVNGLSTTTSRPASRQALAIGKMQNRSESLPHTSQWSCRRAFRRASALRELLDTSAFAFDPCRSRMQASSIPGTPRITGAWNALSCQTESDHSDSHHGFSPKASNRRFSAGSLQRSFTRRTNFSPDQISVTAQTLYIDQSRG